MSKYFFISDTHFDHEKIIEYCDRPFTNVKEMNQTIINNWNSAVQKEDTVFHLGDISLGRHKRSIDFFLSQLSGNIILLKGSHDSGQKNIAYSWYFRTPHHKFFLIHNPKDFEGMYLDEKSWIVHGHKHNKTPLVGKNRRINVSVENINYTPIELNELIKRIGKLD
ncbi:MAG: hypothetical protein V1870_02630 [Candidatus Aenigmatarchaeota archaeon]